MPAPSESVTPNQVVATGTGKTAGIFAHGSQRLLRFRSATWGEATVQFSHKDEDALYDDFKENDGAGTAVTVTTNGYRIVPAGLFYRLNVATYSADVTLSLHEVQSD